MIKIRVNKMFQDKYTGTIYNFDDVIEVTNERFEELKDFDEELVTFIEEIKEKPSKKDDKKSKDEPSNDEPSKDDTSKDDEKNE
jgi:hypothetical protein